MRPTDLTVIEHARALSAATLALAALASAALGPRLGDLARRAARRRLLRSLGEPLAHASDARARDATLEGTLEGEPVNQLLALQGDTRDPGDGPPRWRAPALTLVSPLGRIALHGPLDLRAAKAVRDERVGGAGTALRVGDRVRVAGVLEGVSGGESHGEGYRDASAAWRMVPGAAGALVVACADAAPASRSVLARALAGTVGACVALATLTALAAISLARLDRLRGPESTEGSRLVCDGEGLRWGVLATLSPITYRRALDGMQRTLACREQRALDDIRAHDRILQIAVSDPLQRCLQRADLLDRGQRFEEAATLYESCGTVPARTRAAELWAFVARYDRASALIKGQGSDDIDALVNRAARWHLLAGDLSAARAALASARELGESPRRRVGRWAIARCALLALDETATHAMREEAGCIFEPVERPARCADEVRATSLDNNAEAWTLERTLREVGRDSLRSALEHRDVRAVLRVVRSEPAYRGVAILVALVRAGQRTEADRARLRAFVETEFPHDRGEYDAGTLRWIAGAIDHPALLAEARAVGQRRCDAERRAAGTPAGNALRAIRGY